MSPNNFATTAILLVWHYVIIPNLNIPYSGTLNR
jgi:hypothetical protein